MHIFQDSQITNKPAIVDNISHPCTFLSTHPHLANVWTGPHASQQQDSERQTSFRTHIHSQGLARIFFNGWTQQHHQLRINCLNGDQLSLYWHKWHGVLRKMNFYMQFILIEPLVEFFNDQCVERGLKWHTKTWNLLLRFESSAWFSITTLELYVTVFFRNTATIRIIFIGWVSLTLVSSNLNHSGIPANKKLEQNEHFRCTESSLNLKRPAV